jgi:signal transduction histidine kinase
MKLISKFNRVNIAATIIVFMIGGFCYYFILHFVLVKQLDKDLKIEEQEIMDYVKANKSLPDSTNSNDQKITFEPATIPVKRKITSIDILKVRDDEYETIRKLIFPISILGKNYIASVSKSQQETEDLIQLIVSFTLAIVILLLLVLFIINRFVLNKLWLPFYNTLDELKQFNLSSRKSLNLNNSSINEFKELNNAVTVMSNQVVKDYDSLKSFTENASHEIQTPLAVVNSKLELLMQSENFTEEQIQDIETIHSEMRRLSKLNQSLLLLTKIDNQQFREMEEIDLVKKIKKHLTNYEELISAKQITLIQNLAKANPVLMNDALADVLVSNLITNAIKHNIEHGSIEISLTENLLSVSNTGSTLISKPTELFERFKKDDPKSESLGLGLSIVKKICEKYNFKVGYSYKNEWHTLCIQFA